MEIQWRLATPADYAELLPLLHDADEDDDRIRSLVTDGHHTSYVWWQEGKMVGAVVMRWGEECGEVEYIAVAEQLRGHGHGKAMLAQMITEARRRGVRSVIVGTDNTALGTIGFYQKAGFRMDHVRPDYFSYIQPPVVNEGILLRDMLVLRYTLV
ncbi:GNAT family N-acetyltransferase [Dictyobacter aurantiacus]|uniref:N-acetyltransferase domain-containing protein n=1 Tax=Dictyobacter aurantiacus TaxID=1936993 RepID=A0A401Z8S9_9CHLR|nr:GNAT family N-acetyltransferase [Dictyobacter aurantiacus]GCE03270.1 hypothetical protein KDAU_05990 [Dictyobacter aurantiacus]